MDGAGVPVVVEVGASAARSAPPLGSETLPVTGMGLTLVAVALVAIVVGRALRAVSR
jgi:hypothetical protein